MEAAAHGDSAIPGRYECEPLPRDAKPGMADKIQRASQPGRIKYESAALTVRLLLSEAT